MNRLSREKQLQVLKALVEGNSIRSIERMTGIHRDTIMRLMCRAGERCQVLLDLYMRRLSCEHIEVDEIWTFVGKKQRRLTNMDLWTRPDLGDQYVFIALDADTRLIPAFCVGKRTYGTTDRFVLDLSRRLNGRIQLTTDAFSAYPGAVNKAWGHAADYAQLTKVYKSQNPGPGRYAPPEVAEVISTWIQGRPDPKRVSTSYVERHNLTVRMQIRRFTRLTNGFSKKLANLKAMLAIYFVWYNFVRIHRTFGTTPALQAGITDHVWAMERLLSRP